MRNANLLLLLAVILNQFLFAQNLDSSLHSLNDLVISADRFEEKLKDIPRQIEVINQQKIRQLNAQNTADLLQQTGNVFVQKSQQGGGSPVIRGFEANRILLVLDGVRLNNAIYRSGHLQNILRIDQEVLQKAEVLYGPGSLLYGSDALGGVVNFVTLKPVLGKTFSGTFNNRYSSVNKELTQSLTLSGAYKKFAGLLNVSLSDFGDLTQGSERNTAIGNLGLRNIYQKRIGDTDRVLVNNNPNTQIGTAYKQQNVLAKLLYQPTVYSQHILTYVDSRTGDVPRYDRLSEMNGNTPVFGDWYYGPEKFRMLNYQTENNKVRPFADQIRLVAAVQQIEESRHTRPFGNPTITRRIEKVNIASLNLDARKRNYLAELRYGLELATNNISSEAYRENLQTGLQTAASTRYPDGGSTMSWAGAYLTLSEERQNKWIFTQGIRLNFTSLVANFSDKSFYSFLPSQTAQQNLSVCLNAGIVRLIGQNSKLYANSGNAYRTPNVDDLTKLFDSQSGKLMVLPNTQLKPEQSWTTELGANLQVLPKLTLEANVYYTKLWNTIVVTRTTNGKDSLLYDGKMTATAMPMNAQKGMISGVHLQVRYKAGKYLLLESGYNYTYGRIQNDSVMPLDHIPPGFGRSALGYNHKGFEARFFALYNAAKPIEDYYLSGEDNQLYAPKNGMPAWYTLNLQLGYTLNRFPGMRLKAGIDNILDRNYRVFASGISAPGRNIWVNVRLSF